jgi:hypothetical protein
MELEQVHNWSGHISQKLDNLTLTVQKLTAMVQQLITQEAKMAIDLTAITAEVANNTTVTASVEQLVTNLVAQIAAIPPSTDPVTQAALDALTSTLSANDTSIAAAVTQNTPVPAGS